MLKTTKEGNGTDTFLGQNTSFSGTLIFDGTVRIDGNFEGKIKTNDVLIIAEMANVNAEIEAGVVKILGKFHGTIDAKTKIEMFKPAVVNGTLRTPNIRMEEGVVFNGNTEMGVIKGTDDKGKNKE